MKITLFLFSPTVLRILAVIALTAILPPSYADNTSHYDSDEQKNISVYNKASRSVVTIHSITSGHPSVGTGVFINAQGLILTSKHVVGTHPTTIKITLSNGQQAFATLLQTSPGKADLALLQTQLQFPVHYLQMANSNNLQVGQKVLAIGNPYGFDWTLTTGIISRLDKQQDLIQTDAAINPGCSGGPLLDKQGLLIGINQSIYNPDGNRSNIGIGFAVPSNTAYTFLQMATSREKNTQEPQPINNPTQKRALHTH